jgi:hypothetical protein
MRKALALTIGTALALSIGAASAQTNQRWDRYRSRLSGNVVVIKGHCIMAEDSAAHLKLIDYRDGGGHIVYGCYRHGY